MAFSSVAKGKEWCWKWLRNRPFACAVNKLTFTIEELELIANGAKLLKNPRTEPLVIHRKRDEVKK